MGRARSLSLAAVVLLALPNARAADLAPLAPIVQPPGAEFSGWYLRGDVGYRFFNPPRGSFLGSNFVAASFSNIAAFDAGIGYQFGWLRAEVTSGYARTSHFAGSSALASPDVTARLPAVTTLFNGYVDFGTWYRVTPYVGAGIGFSWMLPTDFASASLPGLMGGNSRGFDLAWDVTAGFAFAFTPNWLIDASYRYLHVGSPKTNLPAVGTVDYGSMDAHEIRTGVRVLMD